MIVGLVTLATSSMASATTLTGATTFGTSSNGSSNGDYWNTLGGDGTYNLYLWTPSGWVNTGDGAGTSININMLPGTYTYTLYANPGSTSENFAGLNLFFNGAGTTPRISVFAPISSHLFSNNSSTNTRALDSTLVTGANASVFVDGVTTVSLTDFVLNNPQVGTATDFVSPFSNAPNGTNDLIGSFTLSVTNTPEPSALILCGAGLSALGFFRRRR